MRVVLPPWISSRVVTMRDMVGWFTKMKAPFSIDWNSEGADEKGLTFHVEH
jgi:hypothetical protein